MKRLVTIDESRVHRKDREGVYRVGASRVTLELLVDRYNEGATPEEMALEFPVLKLEDVSTVVGAYLRNKEAIDRYLAEQSGLNQTTRATLKKNQNAIEIRKRLMARQLKAGVHA